MSKIIGLIAEDDSDVGVMRAIIQTLSRNQRFKIKKHLGRGSGRIVGKCKQWAIDLKNRGCRHLILVRDLDGIPLQQRQTELRKALGTCPIPRHAIVIPIHEIEAWLLSDNVAIKHALKLALLPKEIANPETIRDPKSKLGCCRFQRHRVRCMNETGGGAWSDENLRESSSWRQ
jgi:hypothetical protein